ncbi:efflux RND transporter permease subunit [Pseudanabaena sp. FACHB-2040]|uniref:efflux RND transporter permease subunit n=1 Tax=Pseudanabaena sp. FACHB-2040 TaxID=2692859 RepID=UPI0016822921|nr:efflux RND transporter permease subunit [Pseudanabaena sp. FACHB-2040]MBD2259397.1 efflux RND transporter permease subunit [Pseudanabaena sp. FACHB-2040]
MLNAILKWSIAQRWIVVIGAILITLYGLRTLSQMSLDVFPSFAPPQVEIQAEAPGLAPEEVESLVTLPIESAVNGTPGVTAVRSSSVAGASAVRVVFGWDTDVYQARQLITERLQQAQSRLPEGVEAPQLAPLNSPLGIILEYAFTADSTSLMDVRQLVDRQVTNRLLAVPGITQITVFGGEERQYQVLVDPAKLSAFGVTLAEVSEAAAAANQNGAGGYLIDADQELLIRGIGRIESIEDLQQSVVKARDGTPVLLRDVAEVAIGPALKRGDGSLNGQLALVMLINKQPIADTLTVTRQVEAALAEVGSSLPPDVTIHRTFRQADFIESSIRNVRDSLRDGIIIVSVILLLFLMNWRTAVITLSAIPMSLLICLILLNWFGLSVNTMTLGGLAVAIGSVVDDSIVDMENCYRGLRQNHQQGSPKHPFQVVYDTSVEVRTSVLFSTVIIAVIFAPIFALSGVEGRIFAPMGIAYLVAIFASTLVALTLSPALCAFLLAYAPLPTEETWVSRWGQRLYQPGLRLALRRPRLILLVALGMLVASLAVLPALGRVFLPEFQERSLVASMSLFPGGSLAATNRAGLAVQDALKEDPRFTTIQMRSGRAPGDPHVVGSNFAELDVELSDEGMRDREATLDALRAEFAKLPGVPASIGGFISHRMDEVLSGVRSAIAVKIFGPDLAELRRLGTEVTTVMGTIEGVVDLQLAPQLPVRQVQIRFDRAAAARYGLSMAALADTVETALNGRVVSQVLEEQQLFDLVVWFDASARGDLDTLRNVLIDTPAGQQIPLAQLAQIDYGTGPNAISRENVSRLIVVSSNVAGRDLGSVIADIQDQVRQQVQFPPGYFIQYGGQFESEQRATQNLLVFGALALVVISVLMYFTVRSFPATVMIMFNLPLAVVGGIFSVAIGGGVLSVASLVGFITLFGVAVRNGLLLVDNYNTKLATGMPLPQVLFAGSMERLNAILMTAFTSALGMLPLVIGTGPGREILQPLAVVVLGGLFTSTALTLIVLPALYALFGRHLVPSQTAVDISSDSEVGATANGHRPVSSI